jgi:predicted RNA-binding protein with PIN domain
MPDHLSAATGVVVDPPVGRLKGEAARSGSGHDRVEAPSFVVDLHDVAGLDSLESHRPSTPAGSEPERGPGEQVRHNWRVKRPSERVALPLVRWLVDGMNVIGTRPDAWWRDRHAAMIRLVDMLERWAAVNGEDVTVVFEQPPSPPIRSTVIEVAHAPRPRRDSADDEIVRLLLASPEPGRVRVVTSDQWLGDRVRVAGATVEASAAFRSWIEEP